MWQDIRYALRGMRRSPGFTAVAVVSLALGIGANTAIFSLIYKLMLQRLPVREPGQLVELLRKFPGDPALNSFSWANYEYFRENSHAFSAVIAEGMGQFNVQRGGAATERTEVSLVSGDFFGVLGVKAALGRLIGPAETQAAVVSWAYWKSRYNLDPGILGKVLTVENVPLTIAGVLPREFPGMQVGYRQDIWLPLAIEPQLHPGNAAASGRHGPVRLLGRLKPGATIGQARAEMPVLYQRTIDAGINGGRFDRVMKMELEPAGAGFSLLRRQFGRPLLLMMAVVGLLLLIACTNVASMLLARGAARQREMALRVSLGARGVRLVRQVLTESVLLSGAGCAVGIGLAYLGTGILVRILTSGRPPMWQHRLELDASPDGTVLLLTVGVALATGLFFGLAPALQAFSSSPATAMRDGGKSGETRFRRLVGKSLVVAQVAVSVVLLSSAILFIRHLRNGYAGLGFERERVLLVTLDPSQSGYRRQQLVGPYRELLARLSSIPGVRAATLSGMTPVSGAGANRDATVEGYQPKPGELRYLLENWVAPRYFETLGTPLVEGRDFNFQDEGRPRVAIVNRAMAKYYFGERSAIGKHVRFDGDDRPYEIVGVVGDAKYIEMREVTNRTIYFNAFQEARMFSLFSVRTEGNPGTVAQEVRRRVSEVVKNVPVVKVTTLAEQVDASIVPERLVTTLAGLFGGLGALLAAIGLYGLLAYRVARRTNEIGIRMALGATRGRVVGMVVRDATAMLCAGVAVGAPAAVWAKRFAASLIEGLPLTSVVPIVFGAAAMVAVALIAAYLPARRAAQVDPMVALRYE